MKRLGLLLLAALAACSETTAPDLPALVAFRVDAGTCIGEMSLSFLIDGARVGAKTLSAGQSEEFTVNPGHHIAAFKVAGIPLVYEDTLTVLAGQRYTVRITCVQ